MRPNVPQHIEQTILQALQDIRLLQVSDCTPLVASSLRHHPGRVQHGVAGIGLRVLSSDGSVENLT